MIVALTGELKQVVPPAAHLAVGPIVYELLIPASDVEALRAQVGQDITFHTLMYLEGDPNRGNLEPRLIGFMRSADKRFFELFTTVKGIGPKTALRALSVPVDQIANAIEARDARFLTQLDGIGKRTAELISAELAGKVGGFATDSSPAPRAPAFLSRNAEEESALGFLTGAQMGLKRVEAERLLQRVKQLHPDLKKANELVPAMLRVHAGAE